MNLSAKPLDRSGSTTVRVAIFILDSFLIMKLTENLRFITLFSSSSYLDYYQSDCTAIKSIFFCRPNHISNVLLLHREMIRNIWNRWKTNTVSDTKLCASDWDEWDKYEWWIWQSDSRNQVNLHFDGKVFICAINAVGGLRNRTNNNHTNKRSAKRTEKKTILKYTNIFMIIFRNNNVQHTKKCT